MWLAVYCSYGIYTAVFVMRQCMAEDGSFDREHAIIAMGAFGGWPIFLPIALYYFSPAAKAARRERDDHKTPPSTNQVSTNSLV